MTSNLRNRRKQRRRNVSGRRSGSQFDFAPYMLPGGVVLVGAVLLMHWNSPASREYRKAQSIAKQEEAAAQLQDFQAERATKLEMAQLEAQTRRDELQAQEANNRYMSGCTMLTDTNIASVVSASPQVVAITADTPYYDPNTGGFLPAGQVVCDDKFVTAVIGQNGMIDPASVRRGNDGSLVNKRFDDALGWDPNARRSFVGSGQ
jgi:hypothetical protein